MPRDSALHKRGASLDSFFHLFQAGFSLLLLFTIQAFKFGNWDYSDHEGLEFVLEASLLIALGTRELPSITIYYILICIYYTQPV